MGMIICLLGEIKEILQLHTKTKTKTKEMKMKMWQVHAIGWVGVGHNIGKGRV
ncbi:uncharacterized protein G2W53_031505 [Senna tora]|uniref:Uncharacterized protein n=1 Tax=Senna tora TaxID=362788 RepID=A0A834WFL7_9FABA|nr:uncharacterized protein G2W53_031505 [Senna tora]